MAEQGCGSYLILPHPTTTFFVLHWSVQPAYLSVPFHTSYDVLHWIGHPSYPSLPQPASSYTALFSHPIIQWLSILPYATPSYHNLRCPTNHPTTTFIVLHWMFQPAYRIGHHPTSLSTHSVLRIRAMLLHRLMRLSEMEICQRLSCEPKRTVLHGVLCESVVQSAVPLCLCLCSLVTSTTKYVDT